MIKLANASSSNTSEDRQVRLCDYYDKGWQYVIRPPKEYANGISFTAEKLCNNDNVLYSQEERLTLFNLLKQNNFDLSCINKKVYCDCSSFVGTCLCVNGFNVDVASFTTRTMREQISRKFNNFEIFKFTDKKLLNKGDILLTEGSHTVIVVEGETSQVISMTINGTVILADKKSYLNVRENPSVESKVIGTLNYGDRVKIIAGLDGWYQIKCKDITGYCSKNFISI